MQRATAAITLGLRYRPAGASPLMCCPSQLAGGAAAEREGILRHRPSQTPCLLLDLTASVAPPGTENGRLNLALDPPFPDAPFLYVYYAHRVLLQMRVARFPVATDAFAARRNWRCWRQRRSISAGPWASVPTAGSTWVWAIGELPNERRGWTRGRASPAPGRTAGDARPAVPHSCRQSVAAGTTPYPAPVAAYDHAQGNCAVIGGVIYRGAARPGLAGAYLFGDHGSGRVWTLMPRAGSGWRMRQLPLGPRGRGARRCFSWSETE